MYTMNKLLLTITLVMSGLILLAQENIKNEILSYADSSEIIIRNGRKLVIDKTVSGDHKGAINTLNFLKNNVDESYVIFYPGEELLLSLASRNFSLFLYNAKNYNSLLEGKTKAVPYDGTMDKLREYLALEIPFVSEDLEKTQMPDEDKEIIQIYIRYYTNENMTELNKTIKNFKKSYPDSEYEYFASEIKGLTSTGRMNFCFGYGNEFLAGDITDVFTDHLHILNMEIDGFINQLYLSLFIGGSVSKVRSNIDLPVKKKDLIHAKEEKVSSLKYGIKIGRSVYSNRSVNVFPYISLGGYEMNSQSSEFDNDDSSNPKNNLSGAFFAGFGAASDIVLKRWQSKNFYEPSGALFLRPAIGYDQFFSNKKISKGYDFHFTLSLGVSLGSFY